MKHIERTKLLLHVLDITFHPEQDIIEDFHTIIGEMNAFSPQLALKPQMVLVNKMDIYGPEHRDLKALQKALEESGIESLPVSALTGEGLEELKKVIREKWI